MKDAQDQFLRQRRKAWKQRLAVKLKQSKDVHEAVRAVLDEYLWYSKDLRGLRKRLVKISGFLLEQLRSIPSTRKECADDARFLERMFTYLWLKLREF